MSAKAQASKWLQPKTAEPDRPARAARAIGLPPHPTAASLTSQDNSSNPPASCNQRPSRNQSPFRHRPPSLSQQSSRSRPSHHQPPPRRPPSRSSQPSVRLKR